MTKKNNLQKDLHMSKSFCTFADDFKNKQKYQRLRHYFCMTQTTAYQYFTSGVTSEREDYAQ